MGIKKIKYIILIIVFSIFIFTNSQIFANDEIQQNQQNVRVAIGNQNFQKYNYKEITIFGTSDVQVIDKKTEELITTLPIDTPINIKIKNNVYEISVEKNKETNNLIQRQQELITLNSDFILKSQGGLLGIKDLKRRGKQALYKNSIEILKKPKSNDLFYVVNVLDVQEYLKGVVPNEMPISFGLEALKAQTIAARNYVLCSRDKKINEYDVVDSVASQVYFGANTETEISNKAVKETDGIVAIHNWKLILAQYSSTAGGYTESYENAFSDPANKKFPSGRKHYLMAKADMLTQSPLKTEEDVKKFYTTKPESYDIRSPYYRWQKEWSIEELNQVLARTLVEQSKTGFVNPKLEKTENFGKLLDIKPIRRGDSGKLMIVDIITDKGIFTAQKELVIRRLFQKNNISLPSANVVFDFVKDEDTNSIKIVANGGGFGHGVGMSQYGAGFMGKELKMPYDKILKHYYTDITLGTMPVIISSHPSQQKQTQKFYLDYKNANLIVDNRYNLSKINLIINNKEVQIPLEQSIFPKTHLVIDISKEIKKGENTITYCYPLDEGNMKAARLYIEAVNPNADKFGF
ncbi:MAG: SpoIID/LytB domain-containing protein [Candidatus Gastranaerophilaceae bacterium]